MLLPRQRLTDWELYSFAWSSRAIPGMTDSRLNTIHAIKNTSIIGADIAVRGSIRNVSYFSERR